MKRTLLIIGAIFISCTIFSQSLLDTPIKKLPIDPSVRFGVLDNGMTYYIRHNAQPENRGDFYLAQKVGSMQEEDDQAGLAHFLEHMAFNGTKHFPGRKTMLHYLETIGANFGQNVNAHTGFDETVYKLNNIPMHRESIIDSCLLILHDWSSYITLDNEEIDKERPIIVEEWRTRDNASMRMWTKQLPILFKDSKYANRMPIGEMEVVKNFDYQTLKDYYHKWYRPDLQAVIAVGDFDVDLVEKKIIELFSKIPMPENAAERIYYPVPDIDEPLVAIISDKEATNTDVRVFYKHDILSDEIKNSELGLKLNLLQAISSNIISQRLNEIGSKQDAPFAYAGVFDGKYFVSNTKNAWTLVGISKDNKTLETLTTLIEENERIKRFGFTEAEVERTKASFMTYYENAYNNRDKQNSASYREEYIRSFIDGESIAGIEYEYNYVKEIAPSITVEMLNEFIKEFVPEGNLAIAISGPEKEGFVYPSKTEVLATYKKAKEKKLEAYEEDLLDEPLITELPKSGKVIKEEKGKFDTKIWTLSNGMKVVLKNTDFKDDEVLMYSSAYGGESLAEDVDIFNIKQTSSMIGIGGLGNFSAINLRKKLAGKRVNASAQVEQWEQHVSGSSSIEDVETMLQLTHLIFTAPRKDEEVFNARMEYFKEQLKNQEGQPSFVFSDSLSNTIYPNDLRRKQMKYEDVDKIDYNKIMNYYKEAFANPGSFVFSFVGTLDKVELKPLVEKYLASLPSGNKDAKYVDRAKLPRRGVYINTFEQKMETPKTTSFALYSGTIERNLKSSTQIYALNQILNMVFMESVREEAGGSYGVSAYASIARIPDGFASLQISYDTNPDEVDKITPIVDRELKKLAAEGPKEEHLQKTREYMIKERQEKVKQNGYWLSITNINLFYGEDFHTDYMDIVNTMTADDIKTIMQKLLKDNNKIELMMMPKED